MPGIVNRRTRASCSRVRPRGVGEDRISIRRGSNHEWVGGRTQGRTRPTPAPGRAEGTLVGIPHYSVIEARAHELGRELSRRIQARQARPRVRPRRRLAPGLVYATVRKERKKGWVVSIRRSIVLGDEPTVEALLK